MYAYVYIHVYIYIYIHIMLCHIYVVARQDLYLRGRSLEEALRASNEFYNITTTNNNTY